MANGGLWTAVGVYSQKRNADAPQYAPAHLACAPALRAQPQDCGRNAAWLCSAAAVMAPDRSRTGATLRAKAASQACSGDDGLVSTSTSHHAAAPSSPAP